MEPIGKRLISGGAWAFSGKLLSALSGLVVNVLLARILAPEEFGAYFLVFSLVSAAAVFAQLGMNQAVVRRIAESMGSGKPERAVQAIKQVLKYVSIGALAVSGITAVGGGDFIALSVFDSPVIASVSGLMAIWIVIAAFQSILAEIFRGFHNILLATLIGGLLPSLLLVFFLGGLWEWRHGLDLYRVVLLSVVAGLCGVLVAAELLRRELGQLKAKPWHQGLEIWSAAWPLLVTNLTLFVLAQVDLWVLGVFRSQEEVAIYGAAARLTALISLPLMIINAVTPPVIAEMYVRGGRKKLEKILRVTATFAGIPAFVAFLIFTIWGGAVMAFVYGEYFSGGATVLILLSIGQLANVWSGSCGMTLMMTGNQTIMMVISVFSGVVVLVGTILAVGPYGMLGVAAVASSAMVMQNGLMLYMAKKKCGIWTHMDFMTVKALRQAY